MCCSPAKTCKELDTTYFLQKKVFILNEIFLLFAFSAYKWQIHELLIYKKIFAGLELTPKNHYFFLCFVNVDGCTDLSASFWFYKILNEGHIKDLWLD